MRHAPPDQIGGERFLTEEDPYRYGWRWRKVERADGRVEYEQVPLTYDDLLHPEEEDFIVQSHFHNRRCTYLCDVFRERVERDVTAVVLCDNRVAWDVPELKAHGPDIMVILGVRERHTRHNWTTFDVGDEGVRPALIVEVTSWSTRPNDLGIKRSHYEAAGVPLYIIVDGLDDQGHDSLRLLGYALTPSGYQPMQPDEDGRLWLAPVGVWLGMSEGEILCYDERGAPLGDYVALAQALAAEAQARVFAEAQAQAAQAQAQAERQAREGLEERLRALEAALRQAQGGEG